MILDYLHLYPAVDSYRSFSHLDCMLEGLFDIYGKKGCSLDRYKTIINDDL